ncbi:MAG: hypothetical protein DRR19_30200, partial [Candidatus Parabeggiatoa sp. nov. 1]
SLSHDEVWSVYEDRTGILWIGTFGGGLNKFDRRQNQFVHYLHSPQNQDSLSNDKVRVIYEDKTGSLWIGTREGLNKFDREQEKFVHYRNDPQNSDSLSEDSVLSIYEDRRGILWIGTQGGGLNKFDRRQNQFVHYLHSPQNPDSLSHNEVSAIYEDQTGALWISTLGGGLNRFDPVTETFIHYHKKDGLANDVVYGILEDNQGHLWLSTNEGLSKLNPKTNTFKNYDSLDGLQSNEFRMASHKNHHGELYFGGINGFNGFYPARVKDNPYIPPIVMTDFKIFNKPVSIGEGSPLQQHLSVTKEITLSYKQSFFSFEFAALNFLQPVKNEYKYQLEGFENDWNEIGTRRSAYYTKVPHGTYVFRVKGSNNDGLWNEQGTAIKITILPPPWKTWWAYTLYVITILVLILNYLRVQRQKLREKQQELEREKQIAAQLREADRLKDEFLANTSHELRTPLNGIIGIAESLQDGAAGPITQQINANLALIVGSGRRLTNLVNDILDFSKLRKKEIDLQLKSVDMRSIAEVVLALSQPLIGSKKLQLINAISPDLPPINADENRIQQILYNLVGNAIKFTDSGTVEISAEIQENGLAITVSDTGIGIAAEKLDRIFEAFEQADGSTARVYGGTGLGLAVTQQLVNLHGGQMLVQSQLGVGSKFTFTLPISNEQVEPAVPSSHRSQSLIDSQPLSNADTGLPLSNTSANLSQEEETLLTGTPSEYLVTQPQGEFTILIVDDEPVNRQVLVNFLSLQNYCLSQAASGTEMLALIEEGLMPDLILLDVMMPYKTGFEVTRKIRKKWQADELPIILLTAKNQVADLVVGLESGANDYLTKPVSKDELLARIKTHLHLKQLRAENRRMSAELDVTRRLQQMILPTAQELEQVAGLEIAGFMEPAEEVGGDYYDVLQHHGRILFGIGDVTGHGLESGVLMLMAQTAVRMQLENDEMDPVKFLNTINRTIYKNVERMGVKKNLTLCLLEYQPMTSPQNQFSGILHVSGQHEHIIVVRNDGSLELIDTLELGFPIGMLKDIADLITQTQIALNVGDIVVLYTDGITEAGLDTLKSKAKQYYGLDRLGEIVKKHWQQSAEQIRQAVIDDVRQYLKNNKCCDDITLLIL